MPINQPIITESQADNSWKLELTQQLNSEEVRVNTLISRIEELERMVITLNARVQALENP